MTRRHQLGVTAICLFLTAASLLAFSSCPGRSSARGNIVLVTIESLRSDRLVGPAPTPDPLKTLREMVPAGASRSVLASSSETLPSLVSLMTGTSPAHHGVLAEGLDRLGAQRPTLAEQLRRAGYRTAGYPTIGSLGLASGLSRGFEAYGWSPIDLAVPGAMSTTNGEMWLSNGSRRPGQAAVADALAWVRRHRTEPLFVWIHLSDAMPPYASDRDLVTLYGSNRYDASLAYEDRCLKALVDGFSAVALRDRTTFVVAGNHGESLGEHGESFHGLNLYPPALATAIVVIPPGTGASAKSEGAAAAEAAREAGSAAPGRLIDLHAAILALAQVGTGEAAAEQKPGSPFDATPPTEGLLKTLPPLSRELPLLAVTSGPRASFGWPGRMALYDGKDAWFGPEDAELRSFGPGLTVGEDRIAREAAPAAELRNRAAAEAAAILPKLTGRANLPAAEVRTRVVALMRDAGIARETQRTADENAALREAWTIDPGNFEVARWSVQQAGPGTGAETLPLLREVEARGAGMPEAWLAIAQMRAAIPHSGDPLEARRKACEKAGAACPIDIALALAHTGQFDQALALLGPVAESAEDTDLWRTFGDLALAVQDTYRAGQAYEKAAARRPNDPDLLVRQGDVLVATKDYAGASARYETAKNLVPDLPIVEMRLGKLARLQGDRAAALEHFRKGLGADTNTAAGAIALGKLLASEGMNEEAIPLFNDAASRDSASVEPLYAAAEALAAEGKLDEAEAQLRRALDRDSRSPAVIYQLARLVVYKGNRDEGGKLLEKLAEVATPEIAVAALRDELFTNDAPGQPLAKGMQALYAAVKKMTPEGGILTIPSPSGAPGGAPTAPR